MAKLALLLLALVALAQPARADDISAAARGVVRVVVIGFQNGEIVEFGHGSGFAVAPNRIVTNAHVVALGVEYPDNVILGVVPSEGDQAYPARIVAFNDAKDLALLAIEEGSIPPIPLYMGAIEDGFDVVALGYPGNVDLATADSALDYVTPAAPTRSEGNYSNERQIAGVHALLHTASIARGNSGGPLLDECGRVIGVNAIITRGDNGDAPFGFAISNRELASFLRDAGQSFARVTNECVSMAERLRDEAKRQEDEKARLNTARIAEERRAQAALAVAVAENKDARENRLAVAVVLGALGIFALGGCALMLHKDRPRNAWLFGGIGVLLLAGAVLLYLSRPGRDEIDVDVTESAPPPLAEERFLGRNVCHFVEERSRATVSSISEVPFTWSATGCVNERTQYARDGDVWRRVLVPDGEATASVLEFRPATGEYVVARYLMSAADMERLRALRDTVQIKSCVSDMEAIEELADRQQTLRAALPEMPNERLVYQCSSRDSAGAIG